MTERESTTRQAYTLMCLRGCDAIESVEMMSALDLCEAVRRADDILIENPRYARVEVWESEIRLAVRHRAT